jgi:hypothetical protein
MKKLLDPATNKYYWWYPQSEIDFNRDQMLFLVENYGYLAENKRNWTRGYRQSTVMRRKPSSMRCRQGRTRMRCSAGRRNGR